MSSLKRKSAIALSWDFGGTLVQKSSGFIISIFLARLLSPEEFGLVGMAMVFIAISQVFIDVGFSSALIQRKENTDLAYNSVFYFNIIAGCTLTLVFYFVAPLIGDFYNNESVTNIVRLLSLSFLINSFNQVQSAILTRELNFKVLTIRYVIAGVLGGIIGIIAAFQGMGVYALIIQSLSSGLISTILLWSIATWKPSLKFSFVELKSLAGYSTYVFFDRIISTAFKKLDVLVIAKVFSPAMLGYYSRAVSLKDQVTIYSSTSIQKVFFPVLSSLQNNSAEYKRIYYRVISIISVLSFLLTGLLLFFGEFLILFLFGEKWEPSVPIFEVLVLGVCTYPLNAMMVNSFMSMGRAKENFRIGLIRKGVQLIPLGVAFFYGIYEFTIGVVVVSYFLTLLNIFYLKKHIQLSIRIHLKKLLDGLLPLIPFVLLYFLFDFNSFAERLGLSLTFIIAYYFYNRVKKTEAYVFIITTIKAGYNNYRK